MTVGAFVEAHVGEDIWLKQRDRLLQREPQRSQDGTDGWGGVASPASQAQIPVFPGDRTPRGWAYRLKVSRGTSNTPLRPDAQVNPEAGEEDFSAPSRTAAGSKVMKTAETVTLWKHSILCLVCPVR